MIHITRIIKRHILPLVFTAIIGLSALISCTQRIDIQTKDAPERLVIYGYITNDNKQHLITLSRSSGYFATTPPEGVSDAIVTLSNSKETLVLTESPKGSGKYITDSELRGIEGEHYTLKVSVDFDKDGQMEEFEADSYMPYAAQVDSIGFINSTLFDDLIEVQLYGKSGKNEENYFSFHVSKNDTILNDSLSGFFIISDEYLAHTEFIGLSCFYIDQEDEEEMLRPGDFVELRIDVLTKEYTDFLDNAQTEAGGSIPIFSGPPANVQTNIRDIYNPNKIPVSGFFSAFSGSKASRIYEEMK